MLHILLKSVKKPPQNFLTCHLLSVYSYADLLMSSLHSKLIAIAETKSKSGKIIKAVALRLQQAIAQVDDKDICQHTVEHILASYNCTPAAQKIRSTAQAPRRPKPRRCTG